MLLGLAGAPAFGQGVQEPEEPQEARLEIVRKDRPTGAPLAGSEFWLRPARHEACAYRTFCELAGLPFIEFGSMLPHPGPLRTGEGGRLTVRVPADMELRLAAGVPRDPPTYPEELEVPALSPGEHRVLTLSLPLAPDLLFHGRVVSAENGTPVAGARVSYYYGEKIVVTDDQGCFELGVRSARHPSATIEAAGFGPAWAQILEGYESEEDPFVVRLEEEAVIEGRVLDAERAPVANLWVELEGSTTNAHPPWTLSSMFLASTEWKARTDRAGRVRFGGLPPESAIQATIRTRLPTEWEPSWSWGPDVALARIPALVLSPGEVREVEWVLPRRCHLRGTLCDWRGNPLGRRKLWVVRAHVGAEGPRLLRTTDRPYAVIRSDEDSAFELEELPEGAWWIGLAPDSARVPRAEQELSLAAPIVELGEDVDDLSLRIPRGRAMEGRVLLADGSPAAGARVQAIMEPGSGSISVDADEYGHFVLGSLPEGRFKLFANSSDPDQEGTALVDFVDQETIIRLEERAAVRGTVGPPVGEHCGGVYTYSRAGGVSSSSRDWSDGSIGVGGLRPGVYDLVVRTAHGRIGVAEGIEVRAGEPPEPFHVDLRRGGVLRLEYHGTRERLHPVILRGEATVSAPFFHSLHRGVRWAELVPAGELVVRIQDLEGELVAEHRVEVAADEVVKLEIEE